MNVVPGLHSTLTDSFCNRNRAGGKKEKPLCVIVEMLNSTVFLES